jgi:hypothetical protein
MYCPTEGMHSRHPGPLSRRLVHAFLDRACKEKVSVQLGSTVSGKERIIYMWWPQGSSIELICKGVGHGKRAIGVLGRRPLQHGRFPLFFRGKGKGHDGKNLAIRRPPSISPHESTAMAASMVPETRKMTSRCSPEVDRCSHMFEIMGTNSTRASASSEPSARLPSIRRRRLRVDHLLLPRQVLGARIEWVCLRLRRLQEQQSLP